MIKKEILNQYKKKIKLINEYNKSYYDKNNSQVTDSEFDKLKKEILLLESRYNFLKSKTSPSQIVGYKPSRNFQKLQHRVKMLSLANAFSEEDLINF